MYRYCWLLAAVWCGLVAGCGGDELSQPGQTVLMPQPFPDLFRTLPMSEDEPYTLRPVEPQVLQVLEVDPGAWRMNVRLGEPQYGFVRIVDQARLQPAVAVTQGNTLVGLAPDTTLQIVPAPDYWGSLTFVVELQAPELRHGFAAQLSAQVVPVDDPPRPQPDLLLVAEDDPEPLRFTPLVNDLEVDGDALRLYALGASPPSPWLLAVSDAHGHLLRCGEQGECAFTPAPDVDKDALFAYWVTDGSSAVSAMIIVNVSPQQDAPVAFPAVATGAEDEPLCVQLRASDADGDRLFYEWAGPEPVIGTATLDRPGGRLCWQPPRDYVGAVTVQWRAFDGGWYSAPASAVLRVTNVSDAPRIPPQVLYGTEDVPVTGVIHAVDPDGDEWTLALVGPDGGAAHGTVLEFDPDTGRIVYLGDEDWNGSDTLWLTAVDDTGLQSVSAAVEFWIEPANDKAKAYDFTVHGREDTAFTFVLEGDDPDLPGRQAITFELASPNNDLQPPPPWLSCTAQGRCTGTPPPDWYGTVTFETRADGNLQNRARVTVVVMPVNDAPNVPAQQLTTREDQAVALPLPERDVDGDRLFWRVLTAPTLGRLDPADGAPMRYEPAADVTGTDRFWLAVSDGVLTVAPVTVEVAIMPVNDPIAPAWGLPLPGGVTQVVVVEDGRWRWSIDHRVLDVDDRPRVNVRTAPSRGAVQVTQDTRRTWVSYAPEPDADTSDLFVLDAADAAGAQPLTFAVTVQPVNDPPTCRGTSVHRNEDSGTVTVELPPLANDVDDAADTLRFSLQSQSGSGCQLADLSSAMRPRFECRNIPNASGTIYARYRVMDPSGASSAECTVRINTFPVDDPPTATLSAFSTKEDQPTTVKLTITDIDSSVLQVSVRRSYGVIVGLSQATLAQGTHTIRLTPRSNYHGSASLTLRVSDGHRSVDVSASGTIASVNDADTLSGVTVSDICNNTRTVAGKDSYTTRTVTGYLVATGNDLSGSGPWVCDFGTPSVSYRSAAGRWDDWFGGTPPLQISFGRWSTSYGPSCRIPVYVRWVNVTSKRGADDACEASGGSKDAAFIYRVSVLDGPAAGSNSRTITSTLTVSTVYADDWND